MSEETLTFECPRCNSNRLEEVLKEVYLYTNINRLSLSDGELQFDYGDNSCEDGVVFCYQCLKCGEHIADTEEELLDFLKENA